MSLAMPPALVEAPELAVLEVLDLTLQQTVYALFAVHPELVSGQSFEAAPNTTAETWLADIIHDQACQLQHLITRYREATMLASALRSASGEDFAE